MHGWAGQHKRPARQQVRCVLSIHPNAISWAEVPLSLPVPITQHIPGRAFVQWLVIHTGAVGERERVKEKAKPQTCWGFLV
jgi:hypothetical protein